MRDIIDFVLKTTKTQAFVPLHIPSFIGNEMSMLPKLFSQRLSRVSVNMLTNLKHLMAECCGRKRPQQVATVNGASALQVVNHCELQGLGLVIWLLRRTRLRLLPTSARHCS